jgi:hypothetical protein
VLCHNIGSEEMIIVKYSVFVCRIVGLREMHLYNGYPIVMHKGKQV